MRRDEGFTLLEAIVSIGVLALLSAFILQMFLVSAGANRRAQDMDEANAIAVTAIDLFQSGEQIADFLESDFMADAEVTPASVPREVELWGRYTAVKRYDRFELQLTMEPVSTVRDDISGFTGSLWEIRACAYDTGPQMNRYVPDTPERRVLVEYTAMKYFPR